MVTFVRVGSRGSMLRAASVAFVVWGVITKREAKERSGLHCGIYSTVHASETARMLIRGENSRAQVVKTVQSGVLKHDKEVWKKVRESDTDR